MSYPNGTTPSAADEIMSGGGEGARYFRFGDTPGTSLSGTLVRVDKVQGRDFDTGQPAVYDDGNPVYKFVVTVQTTLQEDADDDGLRAAWLPTRADIRNAFAAAVKAGGDDKPTPGASITITFSGLDGRKKVYSFTYKAGAGNAADDIMGGAPVTAPPAAAAAPQQADPLAGMSPEQIARLVAAANQQTAGAGAAQPPF